MKITLYAAVSVDGFIAREDGTTDWVKDDELFEKTCKDFGCVVMGNNTFKEFGEPPFEDVQYLVLTSQQAGMDIKFPNVNYVTSTENVVKKAQDLGFEKLLIIGGAQCNASFAKASLIDEIWLDEHPAKLNEGIKLFGDYADKQNLEPISSQEYPDFTQNKFKLKKT